MREVRMFVPVGDKRITQCTYVMSLFLSFFFIYSFCFSLLDKTERSADMN